MLTRTFALALAIALSIPTANAQGLDPDLVQYAQGRSGRQTAGVYLFGKKAGWMARVERIVHTSGEVLFEVSSEMHMRLAAEGDTEESTTSERVLYSLAGRGRIQRFEIKDVENGRTTVTRGERNDDGVQVVIETGDEVVRHSLPMEHAGLAEELAVDRWLRTATDADDELRFWTMNIEESAGEEEATVRFIDRQTRRIGGVEIPVMKFRATMQGVPATLEGPSYSRILRMSIGGMLEIREEPEELAKRLDAELPDVVNDASLRAPGQIEDEPDALTLEFSDVGEFGFPHSPRQRVTNEDGITTLRLNATGHSSTAGALSDRERDEALRDTPRLAIRHARVAKAVAAAIGDRDDKARALFDHVFGALEKRYGANATDAVSVLVNGAGDCSEHAMLFVSMARAAGVPAREIGGLVAWQEDDEVVFAHHAWAEFHDGQRWIAIDPIFGEFPVHAGHVKLGEVTNLSWFDVAAKAKVRVVPK